MELTIVADIDYLKERSLLSLKSQELIVAKKLDYKKEFKSLLQPPVGHFVEVDVPEMRFVMVNGQGDPNKAAAYCTAMEWLCSVSYSMKFS